MKNVEQPFTGDVPDVSGKDIVSQTHDIEPQLDALAAEASAGEGAPGDAPAAPDVSQDAAAPATDVAGHEFADQVQQMLDEAAADVATQTDDDTGIEGEFESPDALSDDPAPADDQPAATRDSTEAGDDESEMLEQIDAMLAEGAEDQVMGDFASVDDLDTEGEQTAIAEAAPPVESEPTDAQGEIDGDFEVPGADDEDDPAGDFQSVEEMDDANVKPVRRPLEGERDARLTPAAQAVADELDEDASLGQPAADDDDTTEEPATDSSHADDNTHEAADESTSLIDTIVAKLDAPLAGCSMQTRNTVGVFALGQLSIAFVLIAKAMLGTLWAIILAAVLGVGMAIAVFMLLLRQPDGTPHANDTGIEPDTPLDG